MKTEINAFFDEHGGIAGTFHALYRNAISSDFVRKVTETFATRILLIGIGLVNSVIVARILGPDGRGLYALGATIGAIGVQFGNLGLPASNTYFVAKDKSLLPKLISNSLSVSFGLGGLGVIIAWTIFYFLPHLAPVKGPLLMLALFGIPFGLAYTLLQNLILGIQEIRTYNTIEVASMVIAVLLTAGVILVDKVSVENIFGVGLASTAISFAWVLYKLRSHLPRLSLLPSFSLFRKNIKYGLKAYMAAFFAFLVLRIDLFMIKYMLGNEQTGYYSIAVSMGLMLFTLPTVVGTILFPKLSTPQSMNERWSLTWKTALSTGAIMFMACVGMLFFGKHLISFLFGKAFEPAYGPLVIMSFGIFIWSIESIFRKLLNTDPIQGFRIEIVYIWGATLPVNIVLNLFLIPIMGINGAGMASSISLLFVALCVAFLVIKDHKRYNLHPKETYSSGLEAT